MSGSVGLLRFVDGEDDDGAVVADDVADVGVAAGLFDLVGEDGEDFAFVGEFGGDEAWLWRLGGRRLMVLWGGLGAWLGAGLLVS